MSLENLAVLLIGPFLQLESHDSLEGIMDLLVHLGGGHPLVAKYIRHLVIDIARELLGNQGASNETREEGSKGDGCVRAAIVQMSFVCESLQSEEMFRCMTKDVIAELQ